MVRLPFRKARAARSTAASDTGDGGDTASGIAASSASSQAETKTSKTEGLNYGPGFGPILHLIKNFGVSGSINSDGTGSTNRTDNLTAQITVRVKSVLPNGNLEVEGTRQVGMNAETQTITLSGIVSPQDVTYANTVQSSLVADAQIKFGGRGPVADKQHDGLISRVTTYYNLEDWTAQVSKG